jgi:hypothetical protein
MDINEYERLSNITHNKVQKEALIAGSIFHSQLLNFRFFVVDF